MWLTSTEHYRWDVPRRVVAEAVLHQGLPPTQAPGTPSSPQPGSSLQDAASRGPIPSLSTRGGVGDYAVLSVPAGEADGPMVLLARRRDDAPWAPPSPQHAVDVAVWQLPAGSAAPTEHSALAQPMPRPHAWCTLVATEAEALAIFERQQHEGHSFASYAERVAARQARR